VIDKAGIEADRAVVATYMARQEVRRQFEEMGIDPDEAASRVNGLSDAEIQQVAARINEMPAGQATNVLVVIISAALLIFLVLLVTDLLGLTDIFPFVNAEKRR
ncbi:MAG: PA2779 family protein, partial [Alphaproteobacteria bacterium]